MENKLKQFWEYLTTSHGTHRKSIGYEDDGYYYPTIYEQVPNKTPLRKIITTSIVIGILGLGVYGIKGCIDEQNEKFERIKQFNERHYQTRYPNQNVEERLE